MPKELERRLRAEAKRKALSKERENAYIYGTMAKIEKAKRGKPAK